MRIAIPWFLVIGPVAWLACHPAIAQDVGAVTDGNWTSSTTWTGGIIPGVSNNVYIGSTTPSGAAATATVTISVADELVSNLYLGSGSGTNGTLDLNGHKVIVGNTLAIGTSGGTGTISESGGGSFQTLKLEIHNGNALTFGANDLAQSVLVDAGSTLKLGALASFSNLVDVRDTGSILNLNGNTVNANELNLGYNGTQAVKLDRGAGGTINANLIQVGNGTAFTLAAGDHVNALHLVGSSTITTLNGGVSVQGLLLGGGATATTTDSGNVTLTVLMAGGSTLNMGADLNLSGDLVVNDAGSVVHMNGHTINANLVELGLLGIAAGSLDRGTGGTLNLATGLVVTGTTFDLAPGDKMEVLEAQNGAMVTTAATGNVTVDLAVSGGSTVKLGADLVLNQTDSSLTASQQINVQDSGSTLDAQGHAITAGSMLVGQNGTAPVSVLNLGKVTLDSLGVGNGSVLTLHGGDTIGTSLSLTGGSTLTVQEVGGTGLTLNGTSLSDLTLTSSQLDLTFTTTPGGWDFRWQDPTGGNWIGALQTMINDGQIILNLPQGETYQLIDSGGYTSISLVGGASVPEPSSLMMGLLAAAGLATATAWRRRRSR